MEFLRLVYGHIRLEMLSCIPWDGMGSNCLALGVPTASLFPRRGWFCPAWRGVVVAAAGTKDVLRGSDLSVEVICSGRQNTSMSRVVSCSACHVVSCRPSMSSGLQGWSMYPRVGLPSWVLCGLHASEADALCDELECFQRSVER